MSEGPAVPDTDDESAPEELPEQMRVRRAKLDRLRESGIDPYPVTVARTTTLAAVRAAHPDLEPDTMTGQTAGVTGRVIFFRNTGKLCFATLREGDAELQVMLSRDRVGEDPLAAWKADVDLGDHVLVTGEIGTSRRGELSVFADSWQLTSKSLRPLPVAHKPMSEELRVRRRYVDLIVRDEARRTVRQRATVMSTLRAGLGSRGFLEVETPMLQTVHGGAAARPFRTHMNAFDLDLYLRIAPELFLKRCIVGGLDRVFEINRNFRNEGADSSHSPEFAMLETYQAYADYQVMATLTRELIQECCLALFGDHVARHHDGTEVDLSGSGRRCRSTPWCPTPSARPSPPRPRWSSCGRSPRSTTSAWTPRGCRARSWRSSSRPSCSTRSRRRRSSWTIRWTPRR
ncbi:lysine--tRNA ligase [Blastococcus brunescens]|uniref:Amino acid--tRNA ligase-related protein n=1 Tax=Blastococcus brunescens TaxID=1564165 RepID=A0ABZ1B485_9ACTN|nr:amino acid--tRNA ligase-related protein [Blastococcus sp. BMG 8361]WRL64546.1 amino acid--tRNA ligase-related protein [Blastococcus sp. BMG 8361]